MQSGDMPRGWDKVGVADNPDDEMAHPGIYMAQKTQGRELSGTTSRSRGLQNSGHCANARNSRDPELFREASKVVFVAYSPNLTGILRKPCSNGEHGSHEGTWR